MGDDISVLLIEDDEDDYFLTSDLFDCIGRRTYTITWASDVETGMTELRSGAYDICLVDNRLGAMTGVEILEQNAEALRGTPAILLTGEHSAEVDEAAMRAGATDYLVKGDLTSDMLERAVRYAIQRKASDDRIEYLAYHDPLTDLPNRILFHDRVDHALARRAREDHEVYVVFFDIDNFKDINDTRGHAAGDLFLSQVAKRVRNILRRHDTLARLGGDEFAMCIEGLASDNLPRTFIGRAREALREPFVIDSGAPVEAAASFGVASTIDTAPNPEQLLRNADIAMYEAKRSGRDTWSYYERSMHEALQRRIALEADLRKAIVAGTLDVHYQPFVDLHTNEVVGFEALTRWTHPDLGRQSPADFIALAEETGLIVELGEFVLLEAAHAAARWTSEHGFEGFVSVNVSPRQLVGSGFVESLGEALDYSGVTPERMVIEFTESVMTHDVDTVVTVLDKVAEMGVGIALDDFGTGYSSLSNVHLLPISILKVDRSFVERHDERQGQSMLTTIATMASSLEMFAIAEGIETLAQRDCLVDLGFTIGQGFAYSKAVTEDEASTLLTRPLPPRETDTRELAA